jgi:hypothetical protein
MKRMSLLLLILAAACGSGTDPEPAFSLSFNVAPADTIVDGDSVIFTRAQLGVLDDLRPIDAEVAVGTIRILGSYVAPCSGPQPSADVSRSGNSVALRVDFRPAEGTCADVVQPWTTRRG